MLPSDEQSVTDVTDIGGLHRKDLLGGRSTNTNSPRSRGRL
jgi:hypothetical protein